MVQEDLTHDDTEQRLLALVRDVVAELHPAGGAGGTADLDSRLDKDLGLDSLARVELLARVEKRFDVSLPESVFGEAETPRDLLRFLAAAPKTRTSTAPGRETSAATAAPTSTPATAIPEHAETLNEVLEWHAENHADFAHIRLYDDDGDGEIITYGGLVDAARPVAAGLVDHDVQPGDTVAIMLPTGRDYFTSFIGILMAGAVPVPVYPPARMSQLEEHLKRHIAILENCRAVALITVPEATGVARLLRTQVDNLRHVLTPETLAHGGGQFAAPRARPSDLAFLQYTSGSTGSPKGVMLTHANLLANIRAYGRAIDACPDDVCVSWLPLYHDMGLIGSWFGSLYHGIPLVIMSPLAFLARPQRWLRAIHRYKGTISAGPNFAYELCVRRIQDKDIEGLDLSSWRAALNGAEAISPQTMNRFCERYAAYGFDRTAMMPVYGLAESSVALSFPPLGRGPLVDRIRREPFMRTGRAEPADENETNVRAFVACGHPLAGHQIRIVDAAGVEQSDRREGRLQFKGPSATGGYYRNPESTRALFDGDWLESGDRAYIADGEVYITGRNKDLIIKGGRNIYPDELEDAIGNLDNIGKGGVAVFAVTDPEAGTEQLVVVAESRRRDETRHESLREEIRSIAADLVGLPPDAIVIAPPRSVPKTSSGKIRRAATRERYEQGNLGRDQGRPAWQLAKLAFAGVGPMIRGGVRVFSAWSYAAYFWSVLAAVVAVTWPLVVVTPVAAWRWPVMRVAISLLRRALGIGYTVHGLEKLPPAGEPCIFVSNHASYLDSLILIETLNRPVAFVAKGELRDQFFARVFLERIGAEFVERFDQEKSLQDAQRIVEAARSGRSALFYPEGTCQRMPGLLPFHMGAFSAAAQAGAVTVPITVRGSRAVLRPDTWFPHPGAVAVFIGDPIAPETDAPDPWAEAVRLRDAARAEILRHYGEPDLGNERIVF